MKLKTEVAGMLPLLVQLEDINLSSRRKTGAQMYSLFAKVSSAANFQLCAKAILFDCFIYSTLLIINFARTLVFPTAVT